MIKSMQMALPTSCGALWARGALKVALPALLLAGCGGGSPRAVEFPSFGVNWPERGRAINATESAMSGRARFRNVNGRDLVVNFNRNGDNSAHTETYNIGQNVFENTRDFEVSFFAGANQGGAIVAEGSAQITWRDSKLVGVISPGTKVASVSLTAPDEILVDAPATELSFIAKDVNGVNLAVTPGSARWSIEKGSEFASLTPEGMMTAIKVGSAAVKVSIDGVGSPEASVVVNLPPLEVTDDTSPTYGNQPIWYTAPNGDRYSYIYNSDTQTYTHGYWNQAGTVFTPLTGVPTGTKRFAFTPDGTFVSNGDAPLLWSDLSWTSRTDLTPAAVVSAQVIYASSTTQAGSVNIDGRLEHAALWHGTASSFVDLNPPEAESSGINSSTESIQGGWAYINGNRRACIWRGSAGSVVVLASIYEDTSSEVWRTTDEFQVVIGSDELCVYRGGGIPMKLDVSRYQSPSPFSLEGKYLLGNGVYRDTGSDELFAKLWNIETSKALKLAPYYAAPDPLEMQPNGDMVAHCVTLNLQRVRIRIPRSRLP